VDPESQRERGVRTRERQPDDGRVVLVNLTKAGSVALAEFRARTGAVLGAYLAEISDEQVEALANATETLEHLVALVQQHGPEY
jgi:DNA-binding MarR family transcriptional regulator